MIRQHLGLPWQALTPFKSKGKSKTGQVFEQTIQITNEQEKVLKLRRIKVSLKDPTRDGDQEIYILTNLPKKGATAKRIAKFYRRRWTIETAFQELEKNLHSAINTLGYPKAALFGFFVALVAYNMLAIVLAALRALHGSKTVSKQVSRFYIAEELSQIYRGMMIAIPPKKWKVFQNLSHAKMAKLLKKMAEKINLDFFEKHPRRPKKKKVKPDKDPNKPHVATSKLIASRKLILSP